MLHSSIAHDIICTLQGRWQHGEKVGYCYPSGIEKTLCKWDIYVPLVTKVLWRKGLIQATFHFTHSSDSESIGDHRWVIACQIDWRPLSGWLHVKSIGAHNCAIPRQIDLRPQLGDRMSNRLAPMYGRFPFKSNKTGKWDLRPSWDVTQRRLVVSYRRFGTTYAIILRPWFSPPLPAFE